MSKTKEKLVELEKRLNTVAALVTALNGEVAELRTLENRVEALEDKQSPIWEDLKWMIDVRDTLNGLEKRLSALEDNPYTLLSGKDIHEMLEEHMDETQADEKVAFWEGWRDCMGEYKRMFTHYCPSCKKARETIDKIYRDKDF